MKYDEKYYKKIKDLYKYDDIDDFLKISKEEAKRRWISSYNLKPVIGDKKNNKTLFIMGIGINETPHLGTVMQLLNAIYLQQIGCKVEIILGDLDVYCARSIDMKTIRKTIKKYEKFIINLGFDINKGIVRTQYDRNDIIKTSYILSSFIDDQDFYEIEEDINDLYKKEHVYSGMKFCVKQSISLMFADFIHPGLKEKIKHVIVLSGIDEHGYAWKAEQIRKKMNIPMTIGSLHTRILPGLNDFPKMSKSLKKSVINLDISKKELERILLTNDKNMDNLIYQLMCNVSYYSLDKIKLITNNYKHNDIEWEKDKKRYIKDLYEICKKWK